MTRHKNPYQEKVPFYLDHAALTAPQLFPLMKATRKCRVTSASYKSLTGLAENSSAAFSALLVKLSTLVVADFTFTAEADNDTCTRVAHTLQTGDGPLFSTNSGGGLPTGLAAATPYYAVRIDADNFKLATTRANALAGVVIDITGDGTGTQTLSDSADTRRTTTVATIFDTDSDEAGTNTLTPDSWVSATFASNPAPVLETGEELAAVFLEDGTATLPVGHLHGEATYL